MKTLLRYFGIVKQRETRREEEGDMCKTVAGVYGLYSYITGTIES